MKIPIWSVVVVACAACTQAEVKGAIDLIDATCAIVQPFDTPANAPYVEATCAVVDAAGRVIGQRTVRMPRRVYLAARGTP